MRDIITGLILCVLMASLASRVGALLQPDQTPSATPEPTQLIVKFHPETRVLLSTEKGNLRTGLAEIHRPS